MRFGHLHSIVSITAAVCLAACGGVSTERSPGSAGSGGFAGVAGSGGTVGNGAAGSGGAAASAGTAGSAGAAGTSGSNGCGVGEWNESSLPSSAYYYFIFDFDHSDTQLQFYATMDTSHSRMGGLQIKAFHANRRPALNSRPGCPACSGETVCALMPSAACVSPNEKQLALEHFVDFLPDEEQPSGGVFSGSGDTEPRAEGGTCISMSPAQMSYHDAEAKRVRFVSASLRGEFTKVSPDRWKGSGTMSPSEVVIDDVPTGITTNGNWQAMTLTPAEVAEVVAFGYAMPMIW